MAEIEDAIVDNHRAISVCIAKNVNSIRKWWGCFYPLLKFIIRPGIQK
jgi:hypothetical protein